MKVLQSIKAEPIACNDEFVAKNTSDSSNQHKLNDIQDLLKAHNGSVQDDR